MHRSQVLRELRRKIEIQKRRHEDPLNPPSRLCTEAVERPTLAFERVNDVEGSDGLALGVLGVGDRVPDDVLEDWCACVSERTRVGCGPGHSQIFKTPRVSS